MYAVTVTIDLHPGSLEAFLPHMLTNARASVRDEPGCHVFDVWTDPDRPDTVWLYEVYDDRAAFEAHMATPHFAAMERAAGGMIAAKAVATWSRRQD